MEFSTNFNTLANKFNSDKILSGFDIVKNADGTKNLTAKEDTESWKLLNQLGDNSKQKIITLKRLIELMSVNPLKRFNLPEFEIKIGSTANVMIFDPNTMYEIDSKDFLSKSKNTPFIGTNVFGRIELTICQGKVVYERK